MQLLFRAIITGFGYKIGSELGRLFAERIGLKKSEPRKKEEERREEDVPTGMPTEPSEDEPPRVKAV